MARQISLCQSQERAAKAALRKAETSARALREEIVRLKTTVQQIRTACANDVRKRDVQIQRLKTHLTAQQRGNKTGLVGASITITPGMSNNGCNSNSVKEDEGPGVGDPEYSLKQETTEFLTQLSQSLSDENDNLIGLVRSTLATLKELQGLPESVQRAGQVNETHIEEDGSDNSMLHALPTSYDALATDMDRVLENLRVLLTNPNFVSMDEVEMREEEIIRLREGWVKMEARWKEAITMMEGWRKRMLNGGDTVNLDELKMGLGLGGGLDTHDGASEPSECVEPDDAELEENEVDEFEVASDREADPVNEGPDDNDGKELNDTRTSEDMFDIKLRAEEPALREGDGNSKSPRKVAFASGHPDTSPQHADENALEMDLLPTPESDPSSPEQSSNKPHHEQGPTRSPRSRSPRRVRFSASTKSPHSATHTPTPLTPFHPVYTIDPLQALKRLSSPLRHPDEPSPKLTVQEKLNVAQAEAEAAAVAAGLQIDHVVVRLATDETPGTRRRGSPVKTKIGGRPRRRKSTLSPEELCGLMGLS